MDTDRLVLLEILAAGTRHRAPRGPMPLPAHSPGSQVPPTRAGSRADGTAPRSGGVAEAVERDPVSPPSIAEWLGLAAVLAWLLAALMA